MSVGLFVGPFVCLSVGRSVRPFVLYVSWSVTLLRLPIYCPYIKK